MKFPLTSFLLAIIIWVFCISIFAFFSWQKSEIILATLEVDASIIDNVSQQIKNNNSATQNQDIIEKSDQKTAIEKDQTAQEKNAANQSDAKQNKIATITARPLPEIPEELRQEAFNSYAIARFYIAIDGLVTVELIRPCNNPRLNQLLLQSLRKWKFAPATSFGAPVASTQDVKINFKVE
ncbi:MAG: hypothetical protein EXR06_00635 [Rickettsiales bacterium]|nr:hypothetical protein [Rickettsiales bacterium]